MNTRVNAENLQEINRKMLDLLTSLQTPRIERNTFLYLTGKQLMEEMLPLLLKEISKAKRSSWKESIIDRKESQRAK